MVISRNPEPMDKIGTLSDTVESDRQPSSPHNLEANSSKNQVMEATGMPQEEQIHSELGSTLSRGESQTDVEEKSGVHDDDDDDDFNLDDDDLDLDNVDVSLADDLVCIRSDNYLCVFLNYYYYL